MPICNYPQMAQTALLGKKILRLLLFVSSSYHNACLISSMRSLELSSPTDSLIKLKSLIDSWALNELLIQQAKLNLPESDIIKLEVLVNNYRRDLYSNTYRKSAVNKSLDTLISNFEIQNFLENNQELFKLKAPLYQVRYIHLPPDNVDQFEIQRSFQRLMILI